MVWHGCLEPACKRRIDTAATLQSRNRLLISLAAANTYSERTFDLLSCLVGDELDVALLQACYPEAQSL